MLRTGSIRARAQARSETLYCRSSAGRTDPVIRKILPDAEITMSVDGYISLREYIAQGVGIGLLPSAFGDQDPRLVPASDRLFEVDLKLWPLGLPKQKRLRRVQTLMRFL